MTELFEQIVELGASEILDFCGKNDEKLRELEAQFEVRIVPRGTTLKIIGDAPKVEQACRLIEHLLNFSRTKNGLTKRQIRYAVESIKQERDEDLHQIFSDRVTLPLKKRGVAPMTAHQKHYLDAIRRCDIVFAIGPAGTGKTYLAMAMAVHYLITSQVRRIILVRPAVEAGEKLGFLPGDIAAKFDPFVRPLYDALYDMVDPERARQLIENGTVEIAPLAFMRGRTLNSAFVILDEGQNTSVEQMKMFLTRLGNDSKAVITGDVTQIDLPAGKESGLVHAHRVLGNIEGIEFVRFDETDVVRHELIQKIIRAYDAAERASTTQPELPLGYRRGGRPEMLAEEPSADDTASPEPVKIVPQS
ncbi:MAG: PhoH family protein [Candidatus Sumerlaeaceae bacterium]